jgi:endonuclease YncB( thermonuclease family)
MPSRLIAAAVVALLALVGLGAQRPADLVGRRVRAEVVGIADGDTVDVRLLPARQPLRVRLHGVDAPEADEPFNRQARTFTRVLLLAKEVDLSGRDVDDYGRLVARIAIAGEDASAALLRAGLACHYRRYSDDPVLERAEREARAAGRGFWAAGVSRPACVAREENAAAARSTPVVGNASSRVYHLPTCPNAGCRNCTRKFATGAAAERAGFRPAGDCIG